MNSTYRKKFDELEILLDEHFFQRCKLFVSLLQEWGRVHNFTAKLEESEILDNILDSLYPLKFLNSFNSFADIGTGAGYPGMILAMARPEVKACLIESRSKRVAFLNFVKNSLKLNNLEVVCSRVETIKNRDSFDLITSRAVTNTALLLKLTSNISDEKTQYLFYKGSKLKDELEETTVKKFEIINIKDRNYLYINEKGSI